MKNSNIGFLGLGNMGGALIKGLSETVSKENIFGFDTNSTQCDAFSQQITVTTSAQELADQCDILFCAVKPYTIAPLLTALKVTPETIIVSIAAGVTIDSISKVTSPQQKIVRIMPNTPALIGEGVSALSANENIDNADLTSVSDICAKVGKTVVVPEKLMDAVTGLSGSGPAYVFTFIQAMIDGGVKMGLTRNDATTLAAQTVVGAAKMVLDSDEGPIALRNRVTSPGGTTIAGVHKLESAGFSGTVMSAIEEATRVSKSLG